MEINRRQWLKTSVLAGGFTLFNGLGSIQTLTAEERKKFNPRDFTNPILLSWNENPYGPSERVRNAVKNSFNIGCRYPFLYAGELEAILAKKYGVAPESVIVTGGSTEGLKITGITFAANGSEIIATKPTFLAMMQYAKMWEQI